MSTDTGVSVNWQKFTLLAIALVGMLAMVVTGQVEWSDVSAPFGLIIGYGTANGIGAAKGVSPSPVFTPTNPQRRATDTGPIAVTATRDGLDVRPLDELPADPFAD